MIVSKQARDTLRAALERVPLQWRTAAVREVTDLLDTCDALEQGVPIPREQWVQGREYLVRSIRGYWRVATYESGDGEPSDACFDNDHGVLYLEDVQVVFALPTPEGR